jgi:hypothetical protein
MERRNRERLLLAAGGTVVGVCAVAFSVEAYLGYGDYQSLKPSGDRPVCANVAAPDKAYAACVEDQQRYDQDVALANKALGGVVGQTLLGVTCIVVTGAALTVARKNEQ